MPQTVVFFDMASARNNRQVSAAADIIERMMRDRLGAVVVKPPASGKGANIALTNSAETAFELMRNTAIPAIVVVYLPGQTHVQESSENLARRFPKRVHATSYIGNGGTPLIPYLTHLVKTGEETLA